MDYSNAMGGTKMADLEASERRKIDPLLRRLKWKSRISTSVILNSYEIEINVYLNMFGVVADRLQLEVSEISAVQRGVSEFGETHLRARRIEF